MKLRLTHGVLLACGLGLSACATATPVHVALSASAHDSIRSTEIVTPVPQSEIYVYVPPSQMARRGGGGLLLALIDAGVDSARTHNAEKDVKPLRDAAVDYDFDAGLRNDLQAALSQLSWLHVDTARVVKDVVPANIDAAITNSKDAAVLVAAADYHMSNDGRELTVAVAADLFANDPILTGMKPPKGNVKIKSSPANALYRNTFVYSRTIPGATGKRDENIALWSADGGQALRSALREGSADIARQLAADIQGEPAAPTPAAAGR